MGRGDTASLRSLPRVFVEGADPQRGPIDLPKEEIEKLRKVLRLAEGDPIAVLPNDGTVIRCGFRARQAHPLLVETPKTEPDFELTVAQALPKADKLDLIVRQGTEIGVSRFTLFAAERSVVRWDAAKTADRLRRLNAIAREAAEQSFRCKLPTIDAMVDLAAVLTAWPDAVVLSEVEGIGHTLQRPEDCGRRMTVVVGPEGGWAPRELSLIGDRGVTLGPRVLRVDTATATAAAIVLLR
jgi:16S rRNA (uracil1498-N3)-methyltransferase